MSKRKFYIYIFNLRLFETTKRLIFVKRSKNTKGDIIIYHIYIYIYILYAFKIIHRSCLNSNTLCCIYMYTILQHGCAE